MDAPPPPKPKRRLLTRRRFLAAVAGVGFYTWQVEPRWAVLTERQLPIANLPPDLVGKKLVHISDIHVGPVSPTYLTSWFREISSLKPDLILITGDFMSANYTERIEDTIRQLESLSPGRLGTFAVLGNHDYGAGWKNWEVADELVKQLEPIGIRVLRNELIDVQGLQIFGLDDVWSGRFDPLAAMSKLDPNRASLAMCHNPDGVDYIGWEKHRGWILSGHTHGGQCKPPFLSPPILPVINKRYTSGEFDLSGGRRLYISRGLGHIMKVRFNVRPEVTVFELKAA
ncbi:metallophosphoesterase [Limnoglobus roseus]|uniref:Phosphoesterase n=1 Tax=Limnoglobus roseus TaxID=2598579 RepID=A0A5C1ABJ2_9BACT|nr:metallophosphoesterase [Limnoglobus roseus]QEL14504.1 phosphoesterase [Limnoglobus roseus]